MFYNQYDYLKQIPKNLYFAIQMTGSYYICSPPVENTDIDFILYTNTKADLISWLKNNEFDFKDGEGYNNNFFTSCRKDKFNLLITDDFDYYSLFCEATKLAKKLNLLEKQQRITLFEFILQAYR